MKKTIKSTVSVLIVIVGILTLAACGKPANESELWENAVYTTDTEFGNGAKTVAVEVAAGEKSVTFTIKTDETTVGAALFEHDLISGDDSEYGLYIKSVNGIEADYDKDQSYWSFYIDGEYATSGVDSTDIKEGAAYKLEYTK